MQIWPKKEQKYPESQCKLSKFLNFEIFQTILDNWSSHKVGSSILFDARKVLKGFEPAIYVKTSKTTSQTILMPIYGFKRAKRSDSSAFDVYLYHNYTSNAKLIASIDSEKWSSYHLRKDAQIQFSNYLKNVN